MPEGNANAAGVTPVGSSGGGTPPGADGNAAGTGGTGAGDPPQSFDAWLAAQDEVVKGLLDGHTKGLRTALQSERDQRADLSKQLKEVTSKLEKGSEAATAMQQLTERLAAAEHRATFMESATKPEIGCTNPRLAYIVATEEQAFDRRGEPNWEVIKRAAPELFRNPTRPGSADAGAGQGQNRPVDMNQLIRRAAGRG